jgi:hypothetical protein
MSRVRICVLIIAIGLGCWITKVIWFDGVGRDEGHRPNEQVVNDQRTLSEDESVEQGAVGEVVAPAEEGASRVEATTNNVISSDRSLVWWEDEEIYAEYCDEFSKALVYVRKSDNVTDLDERLSELRGVDVETLEGLGLSAVDWASLGELSTTTQVGAVLGSLRDMRLQDIESRSVEMQRYFMQNAPFNVRPRSLMNMLAERAIVLNDDQLREVEHIYWGAIGERARAANFLSYTRSADTHTRMNMMVRDEAGKVLPRIPLGSEFETPELAEARELEAEINRNYTSLLMNYIRQNEL